MDESQFQRELGKYKIVRLEDYYRPRFKKVESKSGSKLLVHEKKSPLEREKVKTVDAKDLSFWILLESSLNDILTPAETSAFISKMKNGMSEVPGSLNLEDLDVAASLIV